MALPNQRGDLVGCKVTYSGDLGLTLGTMASSAIQTSTVVVSPQPESIFVCVKLSAGALTVAGDIAASGTPAFSSPADTQTVSDTARSFIKFDTTTSSLRWAIKVTPGGSGATVTEFAVFDLKQLSAGEGWFDIGSGANAVASSQVGDGSGTISLT